MKKNTILIVLVVILSLLVLGLSGYIFYDKIQSKDANSDKDVIDNNKLNETIIIAANSGDSYDKSIGNRDVYINERTLKIDGKTFLTLDTIDYLMQVTFYDDIVITYQSIGLSGSLIVYDYNGDVIKEINKFRDDKNRLFYTYLKYSDADIFDVSDDGNIMFIGTKHLQGSVGTYLTDADETINVLNEENDITDDNIVSGIFEISYLGNSKFGDIKYVSTKTVVSDLRNY